MEVSWNLIREANKGHKPSRNPRPNPRFSAILTEAGAKAEGAKKWPRKTEAGAEAEASVGH